MSIATAAPSSKSSALPDDEPLYEVIDGQKVELEPMSALANIAATKLAARLCVFADDHRFGDVVSEQIFLLPRPVNRQRRPDIAFVSYDRWPEDRPVPDTDPWPVVPDLAVEVVSPNDGFEEVHEKVHEYLKVGVRQVWVIAPRTREVYIHSTGQLLLKLTETEELDGGDILPGFRLPLIKILPPKPAEEPSTAVEVTIP